MKIYTCSSVGIDYFFFLGNTLKKTGYDVEEIYLIDERNYRILAKAKGFKKVFLRFNMYITYPLLLIVKTIFAKKKSVFIVSSNTFYAPLVVNFFSFGRVKIINLVYDLFPDALEVSDKLRANSINAKLIGMITKANLRHTNATVYLGDYLATHSNRRWALPALFKTIDISADYSLFNYDLTSPPEDLLVFHYGGQLGHLHDVDSLISCIKNLDKYNVSKKAVFNFYISGAQARYLQKELTGDRVSVIQAVPSNQWRLDIKNFHIGIVSLTPGGATVCLPSKTYAMMGGGLAIIAICPIWSDLAKLILNLNAGWVINNSAYSDLAQINPENYLQEIKAKRNEKDIANEFKQLAEDLIANPSVIYQKRENAFNGVRQNFNINNLAGKWNALIEEVIKQ